MRQLIVIIAVASCIAAVGLPGRSDEPKSIALWPNGAPGSETRSDEKEMADIGPGKYNVTNVHQPSITPYLPSKEKATGAAVLIAPGGGHRMLCLGHEGYSLGQWFADNGIAAFVLKYRLAREEGSTYTVDDHAMADTRRALRLIRNHAAEWGIKPDRIGILGFSAGGELAALASMKYDDGVVYAADAIDGEVKAADAIDRESCRPAFQALIYPGSSSRFTVNRDSPPVFIALGFNDRDDIAIGMAELYLKYKKAGVPAELHIYSNAGHGFGHREGTTTGYGDWTKRFREWLADSKLLD